MSEPLLQSKRKETHRPLKPRIFLFTSILLLILLSLSLVLLEKSTRLDSVRRFLRYEDSQRPYPSISLDYHESHSFACVQDRFAVATQEALFLYGEDGTCILQREYYCAHPALLSRGDYLLYYDIGGTQIALFDQNGSLLYEKELTAALYDCDLTKDGLVCLLQRDDTQSRFCVLDQEGGILWQSADTFSYTACALNADGSALALTALTLEKGEAVSLVKLFSLPFGESGSSLYVRDQLIWDLTFLSGDRLCLIGEAGLLVYRGTALQTQLQGSPQRYAIGEEHVLFLAKQEGDESLSLFLTGPKGEPLLLTELSEAPLFMDIREGYAALLTQDALYLYDSAASRFDTKKHTDLLRVFLRKDGTAFCLSAEEAYLYIP